MDLPLHHICGLDELSSAPLESARRIVSILDPTAPDPPELRNVDAQVLTLRFDDVIEERPPYRAPEKADIERLLAFDSGHAADDRLVIHCHAGISRSTAAYVTLLAQRLPSHETEIFADLRSIRPEAWPNSRMIAMADELLDAGGRLSAALREHYKHQLRHHPAIGRLMISLGREREIPFDRLTPG